jgi:hypothetical protein
VRCNHGTPTQGAVAPPYIRSSAATASRDAVPALTLPELETTAMATPRSGSSVTREKNTSVMPVCVCAGVPSNSPAAYLGRFTESEQKLPAALWHIADCPDFGHIRSADFEPLNEEACAAYSCFGGERGRDPLSIQRRGCQCQVAA